METTRTKVESSDIDSSAVDGRLMIERYEAVLRKIERAKYALKIGLAKAKVGQHGLARISFQAALDELRGIGEG